MRFVILTPNKKLLDIPNVEEVIIPGESGLLGILPNHAPLVTTIKYGVIIYTIGNTSGIYRVSGGVANILDDTVTVCVDVCEEAASIDVERAKSALERAEARLSSREPMNNLDLERAENAKLRAKSRLEASELYSQSKDKK